MSQTSQWHEVVDTGAPAEHRRLALLEEIFDPWTVRNLDRFGLKAGWSCLEVGAGGGSIARVLADRVGGTNVVATDLSTDLLAPLTELGVAVLRHDVTADPAPGEFDFVHVRFVVDHLPKRELALKRMASWLRPGGWLLAECGTTAPELSSRAAVGRAMAASNAVLAQSLGTHSSWARTLPLPLEAAGLLDCVAEGTVVPVRGGSPLARWLRASYQLVDERVIAAGVMTRTELDEAYLSYDDPSFVDYTWFTVAAWGRRG
jgi:2-polyprenyl-3-methyl-5-hydroxy-6-metoxy-1,4-benzoquinol methylase